MTPPKSSSAKQTDGTAMSEERAKFEARFRFDFTTVEDAWGKPKYKQEHVESIWYGWQARALLSTAPEAAAPVPMERRKLEELVAVAFASGAKNGQGAKNGWWTDGRAMAIIRELLAPEATQASSAPSDAKRDLALALHQLHQLATHFHDTNADGGQCDLAMNFLSQFDEAGGRVAAPASPPPAPVPQGASHELAKLRFFRDLSGSERFKFFQVFGILPDGVTADQLNHSIEGRLFDRLRARAIEYEVRATAPKAEVSGSGSAEPSEALSDDEIEKLAIESGFGLYGQWMLYYGDRAALLKLVRASVAKSTGDKP